MATAAMEQLEAEAIAQGRVGGRTVVALMYVLAVAGMATVGIVSPLATKITTDLGAAPEAIGLTIALFSLPSALVATLGGGIVDRVGPKLILTLSALIIAAGDALLGVSTSLRLFDLGMLVIGLGYVGVVIGAPAMMIGALGGAARTRGMAFFSTYAPTGFAVGLLMAVPFTGGLDWRLAMAVHGVLLLACAALTLLLPHVARVADAAGGSARLRIARLFEVVRNRRAVRLSIAVALPNIVSYGTSLVAATYLARVHGVSLAASATVVAIAKIVAMLAGGTIMGALLARDVAPRRLFVGVVGVGIVAQFALYLPLSPFPLAVGGLMGWLFAFGGLSGVCMALLPTLATNTLRGGAVAGLNNQFISIGSFLTPAIYFALPGWPAFVSLAVVALIVALIALPTAHVVAAEGSRTIA